jgi:hypothetical protein
MKRLVAAWVVLTILGGVLGGFMLRAAEGAEGTPGGQPTLADEFTKTRQVFEDADDAARGLQAEQALTAEAVEALHREVERLGRCLEPGEALEPSC